mmetsp:Transcript_43738/g.98276  ORF Transcript_43738/g.98276 Transcript_43738/m.98276 type:complete len:302 (-) Transcript_43738:270-1175(-)
MWLHGRPTTISKSRGSSLDGWAAAAAQKTTSTRRPARKLHRAISIAIHCPTVHPQFRHLHLCQGHQIGVSLVRLSVASHSLPLHLGLRPPGAVRRHAGGVVDLVRVLVDYHAPPLRGGLGLLHRRGGLLRAPDPSLDLLPKVVPVEVIPPCVDSQPRGYHELGRAVRDLGPHEGSCRHGRGHDPTVSRDTGQHRGLQANVERTGPQPFNQIFNMRLHSRAMALFGQLRATLLQVDHPNSQKLTAGLGKLIQPHQSRHSVLLQALNAEFKNSAALRTSYVRTPRLVRKVGPKHSEPDRVSRS